MKSAEKLLQPVYGYIELGLFAEAAEELERRGSELWSWIVEVVDRVEPKSITRHTQLIQRILSTVNIRSILRRKEDIKFHTMDQATR